VTGPAAFHRDTLVQARTFGYRLQQLADDFIDRDEAVRVIGLAALCREHVLLVGPPGTAKTSLIDRFRRMLDVTYFTYLLTRFTEPAELFGPIDVRAFQEDSVYRVNTTGMLPQAHIAFLDEVFQGSSAILNTLLTLINERTFNNGGDVVRTPLLTLLGSSNEIPDDPVLAAFGDRFLLRCRLGYVAGDEVDDLLTVGWNNECDLVAGRSTRPVTSWDEAVGPDSVRFDLATLTRLQAEVTRVDLAPVRDLLVRVVRSLRAEGVAFSDRRAVKAQKLIAASALMAGRATAEPADLGVIAYLWTDPKDELTLRRLIRDQDVPLDQQLRAGRPSSDLIADLNNLTARSTQASSREERRELVRRLHRLLTEARRDHPVEHDLLARVGEAHRSAIGALQDWNPEEVGSHV
jgi:MoxR-like ATPase